MPSSSSFWAMTSLSSTEKEMDSPWVPSRSVVSKVEIFIISLGRGDAETRRKTRRKPALCSLRLPPRLCVSASSFLAYGYTDFFLLFEERHHFAELAAHGF